MPSLVSIRLIPAVNRIGSAMMACQGMCSEARNAVVVSSSTSVAASKSIPKTTELHGRGLGSRADDTAGGGSDRRGVDHAAG
jgi:hypothetical protein